MNNDKKGNYMQSCDNGDNTHDISIPGVDVAAGIRQCGSPEMYKDFVRDVYEVIEKRCCEVERYLACSDPANFTTTVHALKTTCRMLGATGLSENFFELEKIGKVGSLERAAALTPDVLARFRGLIPLLEPYLTKEQGEKNPFSAEEISSLLTELTAKTDDFDITGAEEITKKLFTYECDKELSDRLTRLSELVNDLDYDEAGELAAAIIKSL